MTNKCKNCKHLKEKTKRFSGGNFSTYYQCEKFQPLLLVMEGLMECEVKDQ